MSFVQKHKPSFFLKFALRYFDQSDVVLQSKTTADLRARWEMLMRVLERDSNRLSVGSLKAGVSSTGLALHLMKARHGWMDGGNKRMFISKSAPNSYKASNLFANNL